MTEILRFLYEKAIDPLTLPLHPVAEWVILWAIDRLISYPIAYRIVGRFYDEDIITSSFLGKVFHWVIRGVVFLLNWFVVYSSIIIYQWATTHIALAITIAVGIVILAIVIAILIDRHKTKLRRGTSWQ